MSDKKTRSKIMGYAVLAYQSQQCRICVTHPPTEGVLWPLVGNHGTLFRSRKTAAKYIAESEKRMSIGQWPRRSHYIVRLYEHGKQWR